MSTFYAINSALEDKLLHHQVSGDDKDTTTHQLHDVGNQNRVVGTDTKLSEVEDNREVSKAVTWNAEESVLDSTYDSKVFLAERIVRNEVRTTKVPRRYARIDRRTHAKTERNISECLNSEIRQCLPNCPVNTSVVVRESRFDDSCRREVRSSARRAKQLQQAPNSCGNSSTSSSDRNSSVEHSSSTRHVTPNNVTGKSIMCYLT